MNAALISGAARLFGIPSNLHRVSQLNLIQLERRKVATATFARFRSRWLSSSIGDRSLLEDNINVIEAKISTIEQEIDHVNSEIVAVESEIKLEKLREPPLDKENLDRLYREKEQLRKEKEQLRTKEEQLRTKEEQLRTEKALPLQASSGMCFHIGGITYMIILI
jgi:chromosome segregation ATPase